MSDTNEINSGTYHVCITDNHDLSSSCLEVKPFKTYEEAELLAQQIIREFIDSSGNEESDEDSLKMGYNLYGERPSIHASNGAPSRPFDANSYVDQYVKTSAEKRRNEGESWKCATGRRIEDRIFMGEEGE